MSTVYVTGCLGFIGSRFTELLMVNGHRVIGVDAMTYAANQTTLQEFQTDWRFRGKFKFLHERIENLPYLHEHPEFIVNFAAETHVDNSITNSALFMKSNIDGVRNLLELVRTTRGKAPTLIHISTDEVYGDIQRGKHLETDMLKPSNPYSATKAAADMLITAWARTYGIEYNIIRPTNNYGPGQHQEKLIPSTISAVMNHRKVMLHNRGTPIRTWLHVEDTARAVYTVMNHGKRGEIYNVSGNKECTNNETVRTILNTFDERAVLADFVDYSYDRPGQDVRYAVDDTKLQALGWQPTKTFETEICNMVHLARILRGRQ